MPNHVLYNRCFLDTFGGLQTSTPKSLQYWDALSANSCLTSHQQVSEVEIASRLDCFRGTPLIVFNKVAYNIKGQPILCSLVHHHHEHLYLNVVRSK